MDTEFFCFEAVAQVFYIYRSLEDRNFLRGIMGVIMKKLSRRKGKFAD